MRHVNGEKAYRIVQMMHVRAKLGYSGHIDDNILHIFSELPVTDQKTLLQVAVRVWSDHRTEPEKVIAPEEKPLVVEPAVVEDKDKLVETDSSEMVQMKGWALKLTAVIAIVMMALLIWLFAYTLTVTPVPGEDSLDEIISFIMKLFSAE